MWVIYAIGSAVAASLVPIFGKIGLRDIDPTLATIIRAVLMAVIMVAAGFLFGKYKGISFESLGSRPWLFILLSALAGALSWLLYFIALRTGPAGSVAVIDKFSVVLVLIIAAFALGETLTAKSIAGIILLVAGSLLILFK